jgi:ABC-type histidine transport system ATPase subunit
MRLVFDEHSGVDEVFGAPKSERNKEFVDKILMRF